MTRSVVIMLGAPGAGKGTQAVRLSGELGLPHVSTGDLFRENLSQGTALGAQAKEYMESGRLVPDELVIDMLFDRVARPDCADGYLLDGFPRTVHQARVLDARLGDSASVTIVNLVVPDEVIVERAAGRLLCRSCNNIAHRTFAPPRTAGVCDACGGELYTRDDDAPEVVRKRLAVYHEQTAPVVDFYAAQARVCSVDGGGHPDAVFESARRAIQVPAQGERGGA
jgi:adenylate kinase